MAMDFGELSLEDDAEHFDLEATFFRASQRDFFGILATCCDHVELLVFIVVEEWADCDSSAGLSTILVCSDFLESLRVEELDISVSRARH